MNFFTISFSSFLAVSMNRKLGGLISLFRLLLFSRYYNPNYFSSRLTLCSNFLQAFSPSRCCEHPVFRFCDGPFFVVNNLHTLLLSNSVYARIIFSLLPSLGIQSKKLVIFEFFSGLPFRVSESLVFEFTTVDNTGCSEVAPFDLRNTLNG